MSQRTAINSRLQRLGSGELVAAAVFALLGARVASSAALLAFALWSALVPLLVVLAQAGVYWLVRSRTSRLPPALVATYRGFRVVNLGLLTLGLAGVVLWWPAEPLAAVLVLAVWLFGVVEYANYFVVRLAYPPRRWLAEIGRRRMPRLMKDLGLRETGTSSH